MGAIFVGRLRHDRGMSVARPTALGNPFVVGKPYTRAESISRYREWFAAKVSIGDPAVIKQLHRIEDAVRVGDLTLLCHCAPSPCHAEVIAEYVRVALASQDVANSAVSTESVL